MNLIILLIINILISVSLLAGDRINEEIPQDFVLETKQIRIPYFTGAFNPSIIRWGESLLMSFRVRNAKLTSTFEIALVWLDKEFNPITVPQILDIRTKTPHLPRKEQDPRLVIVGHQLYMVYSNDIKEREGFGKYETRRVFVTKLHQKGRLFHADLPECLVSFEGERLQRWEKNWVPFDYQGKLLLAYSLIPHRILHPLLEGSAACETFATTSSSIHWNWGHLRGGTPALQIDDGQYLSFFHSSKPLATTHSNGLEIPHYFMGGYTFSASPPFTITHISPEPIIGEKFYKGPAYKTHKPLRVVFPGGFIMDKKFIWVVYGRQDHELWVVKLDRKGLLNSLIPLD